MLEGVLEILNLARGYKTPDYEGQLRLAGVIAFKVCMGTMCTRRTSVHIDAWLLQGHVDKVLLTDAWLCGAAEQ